MPSRALKQIVGHLIKQAAPHDPNRSDDALLQAFLKCRNAVKKASTTEAKRVAARPAVNDPFEVLVVRYSRVVMNQLDQPFISREDAEDLFQEVFVLLASKASELVGHGNLCGWLVKTAENKAKNFCRKRRRRADVVKALWEKGRHQSVVEQEFGSDVLDLIKKKLNVLPERERAVLTLRFLEEKSYEEVFHLLGISVGTAKWIVSQHREWLRRELTPMTLASSPVSPALILSTVQAAMATSASAVCLAGAWSAATVAIKQAVSLAGAWSAMTIAFKQKVVNIMSMWFCTLKQVLPALLVIGSLAGVGSGAAIHKFVVPLSPVSKPDEPEPASKLNVGTIDLEKVSATDLAEPEKSDKIQTVGLHATLTGKTKAGEKRNVYFLVSPISNPDAKTSFWSQQDVERKGDALSCVCQFGEGSAGELEFFAVVAVATKEKLDVGQMLQALPKGEVLFSKPLIVKRKQD